VLVVIGASTLDALWIIPAQRDLQQQERGLRARQRDLRAWHCANPAPTPPPARATRVDNVLLLR